MKLLLTFFFLVFLTTAWSTRRGRPIRVWPLLVASIVIAAAFQSLRVI